MRKYYTVYNNRTDELVCLDATAEEAAKAMRLSLGSFRSACSRSRTGINKKWHVEATEDLEELE